MKEVIIGKNDSNQRLDRFLKKYLSEAPNSFIYRMVRKKNIELNRKKAKPETIIYEGDKVQLFLSDETINKFKGQSIEVKSDVSSNLIRGNIIYEDKNIILINKPKGALSHGAGDDSKENVVDSMVSYLIEREDYDPEKEKTFIPSICNRLDRNTSGIIIGAKNYKALQSINESIRKRKIRRFYKTIVKGEIKEEFQADAYLEKDNKKNKVKIYEEELEGRKKIITNINPLKSKNGYSMLEIELITGRTHQIRGHLSSLGYPILGDRKYGDFKSNRKFNKEDNLDNQLLHGYKVEFNGFQGELEYLNNKTFKSELMGKDKEIGMKLFQ